MKLGIDEFASLLGTESQDIERKCGYRFERCDLQYKDLSSERHDNVLLEVIKAIDQNAFTVSGKKRESDWESGWAENLEAFMQDETDETALVPKYIQKTAKKRLFKKYIEPLSGTFELDFYTIYREYIFKTYLSEYDQVYEFGCGTGYNLLMMAKMFPEKVLLGLDWADSAVELVNRIGQSCGCSLKGRKFDFFHPDHDLSVQTKTVFLTLNSMEQIGDNYSPFLEYILQKRPAVVINSEPLIELYDDANLLDYLAIKYHRQRNYLNGYLKALKRLEADKVIEILNIQRVPFGSLFHEGYSIIIWRCL